MPLAILLTACLSPFTPNSLNAYAPEMSSAEEARLRALQPLVEDLVAELIPGEQGRQLLKG